MVGRGAAYADYDGDGDLDVLVSANNGHPALLRNDGGNRNRCLRVRLIGGGTSAFARHRKPNLDQSWSNRDGIGATVRLRSGGGGADALRTGRVELLFAKASGY